MSWPPELQGQLPLDIIDEDSRRCLELASRRIDLSPDELKDYYDLVEQIIAGGVVFEC